MIYLSDITNVSLSEQAFQEIRRMIVTLELAPGAVVRDDALQQQLGLGRTPIREALQRLVRDQFVTVIAGRGGCDYPEESAQRVLIGRIFERWAAGPTQKLIGLQTSPAEQREQWDRQLRFLEDFDVGYQRRQLRFVIDWIDEQYTKRPTQQQRQLLDDLKHAAAARVDTPVLS